MRRLLFALVVACLVASDGASAVVQILGGRVMSRSSTGVDTTDPVVAFVTPTSGSSYDSGSTTPLSIAGTASDASGITGCTYSYDGGSATALTGTTSWSGSVALSSGTADLVVTCTDGAGRTSTDTLSVSYATLSGGGVGCSGACFFETSFTTAQGWDQDVSQWVSGGGPCTAEGYTASFGTGAFQSGVNNFQTQVSGSCDAVIAAANNSAGAGGRGFRKHVGTGVNSNSGGVKMVLPSAQDELWFSVWIRYSDNIDWAASEPQYIKEFTFGAGGPVILGHQGGAWGYHILSGSNNRPSSKTWVALMGGQTGDATWHCFDWYLRRVATTQVTLWIDGVQVLDESSITGQTTMTFGEFHIGNQSNVSVAGTVDMDDFRFDTGLGAGERLGCPGE